MIAPMFWGLLALAAAKWAACLEDLYATERHFFEGARCDRRFRVRVDWPRYFARVQRPRRSPPAESAVCAPLSCGLEEVQGCLFVLSSAAFSRNSHEHLRKFAQISRKKW